MEPRARAAKNRGQQNFSDTERSSFRIPPLPPDPQLTTTVQMLLFAHGDTTPSLQTTMRVLDEILTDFIISLCFEADRPAQLAGRQKVKLEDFKFACRKDPLKLGKIEEVFEKKSEIDAARKALDVNDDKVQKLGEMIGGKRGREEVLGEQDDVDEEEGGKKKRGKYKKRVKEDH